MKILTTFLILFITISDLKANEIFICERGSAMHGRVHALSFGSYKSGQEAKQDIARIKMVVHTALDNKKSFLPDTKLVIIKDTQNSAFHVVDSTCYTNRAPLGEASSMAYILKNKYGLASSYFEVYGKGQYVLDTECE